MRNVGLWIFIVLSCIAAIRPVRAEVLISDDRGGKIGVYMDRANELVMQGESLRIAGPCLSACTILVARLRTRTCVTGHASLGFHAAFDEVDGKHVTNAEATKLLWSLYPARIRSWIERHGGLQSQMIFLNGRALFNMFPVCGSPTAYAMH